MSKQKMLMARTLIEQKRYAAARKLLLTIDHPTAKKWLAQLDRVAPASPKPTTQTKKQQPTKTSTEKSQPKPVRKKITKKASQPTSSGRRSWIIGFITTILGFIGGLVLGMNLATSNEEPGIKPLDLTRQAIFDANGTTEARIVEATNEALITPSPSSLELTATAIIDLNATTIAIIDATGTASSQPTQELPEATPTVEAITPTFSPDSDSPFGSSDNTDDGSNQPPFGSNGPGSTTDDTSNDGGFPGSDDDGGPPFGDTGSTDDTSSNNGFPGSSDDGPPFGDTGASNDTNSSGFPGASDPTPTQEG